MQAMPGLEPESACLTRVIKAADRIAAVLAYLSGALLLCLAVFMTLEVTSRYLDGPFTGISDEISTYVLVLAGTWSLSFALSRNAHVRIDFMVESFPPRMRSVLGIVASFATLLVALVFAWQTWVLALDSLHTGIKSISVLQTPMYLPQGIVAIGLTLLAMQAFLICAYEVECIARGRLPEAMGPNESSGA